MMLKRLIDTTAAVLALLLLAPVMLLIAVLVRLDSPGPAIFRQVRVGMHGRHFEIMKFRTMRSDAPGRLITATGDSRITRTGAFLRAYKLDELPQLINVLAGDMSLVGPRPEVPRYVELYPPRARDIILSVRPGITDEASIVFRDESKLLAEAADPERCYVDELLPRKLRMYEAYVQTRSTLGDLGIIGRTVLAILRPPAD